MKTPPNITTFESAPSKANSSTKVVFTGTDNPRHLRAIQALLERPQPREHLDIVAGCSNSPELVAELRRKGLSIPCKRIDYIDRDGRLTHPGIYYLDNADRRKIKKWLAERGNHGL